MVDQHQQQQQQIIGRNKALADAAAGVIGSLVSLWTFYPIEVWKTNLQASGTSPGSGSSSTTTKNNASRRQIRRRRRRRRRNNSRSLFQGCHIKTLHTTSSSFCYFYIYSTIMNFWKKQHANSSMNTSTRLLLTAIAAMFNTFITLPLDVLSSKHVTSSSSSSSSTTTKEICFVCDDDEQQQQADDDDEADDLNSNYEGEDEDLEEYYDTESYCNQENKDKKVYQQEGKMIFRCDINSSMKVNNNNNFKVNNNNNENENDDEKRRHRRVFVSSASGSSLLPQSAIAPLLIRKQSPSPPSLPPRRTPMDNKNTFWDLWKGLVPALLLCSNPSINYTIFDIAKTRLINSRRQKQQQRNSTSSTKRRSSSSSSSLTMPEAFLIGLFAKFVATIATYPLIRAKVIMMVSSETSLIATLCRTYQEEGVSGLFKGCDWQLLHTVLKSALMMMVREKITYSTHRLIVGTEDRANHR